MINVVKLTKKLVAFNTVSSESNMRIAYFLERILRCILHFDVELQPGASNGKVAKANLIARMGPKGVEPLVLSAHMDVVPPGKGWKKTDPFQAKEIGGKLFGRGAADMKGPLAALVCAVEPLTKARDAMKRELIIAFSFDEEVGLVGAKEMVKKSAFKPKFVLVAEPTEMKPMRMHKGIVCMRAICHGQTAHGSQPQEGINAIELATEVVGVLQRFREEELKSEQYPGFSPPYATLNIGKIIGGEKYNIVPDLCTVEFEIRYLPGQSVQGIIDDLTGRMSEMGSDDWDQAKVDLELIDLGVTADYAKAEMDSAGNPKKNFARKKDPTEPVCTSPDSFLVKVAERVTGFDAAGVAFSTDASALQKLGGEYLILGPGSFEDIHKPDEFVRTDQLLLAVEQFREIVRQICFQGVEL